MTTRHREPKPEEELDFDDKDDTGERKKFKPRGPCVVEDERTQDGIVDNFMSGLPGDTITTSRDEIRKITKN